jgi:hypothetical protein
MYGFRPISDGDEAIYFLPVEDFSDKSNSAYLSGAGRLHFTGSSKGFLAGIDIPKEVVDHEIIEQLQCFVKEGNLNEFESPALLTEFIIQTVEGHPDLFDVLLEKGTRRIQYPLVLSEVKKCVLREKLRFHYRGELIREKRESGVIEEVWNGDYVSYQSNISAEEYALIEERIERDIDSNIEPNYRATDMDILRMESLLMPRIAALKNRIDRIEEPQFSNQEGLRRDSFECRPISIEQARVYLVELYCEYLNSYKSLVETNFPAFKENFDLYRSLPVRVLIELGATKYRGPIPITSLTLYIAKCELALEKRIP